MDQVHLLGHQGGGGADGAPNVTISIPLSQYMSLQQLAAQQQQFTRVGTIGTGGQVIFLQQPQQLTQYQLPIVFGHQQTAGLQALPRRQLIGAPQLSIAQAGPVQPHTVTVQAASLPQRHAQAPAPRMVAVHTSGGHQFQDLQTLVRAPSPASRPVTHAQPMHVQVSQALSAPSVAALHMQHHNQHHHHSMHLHHYQHPALTEGQATSGNTASTPPSPSTCGPCVSERHQQPQAVLLRTRQSSSEAAPAVKVVKKAVQVSLTHSSSRSSPQPRPSHSAAGQREAIAANPTRRGSDSGTGDAVNNVSASVLVAKALTRSDAHTRRLILPRMSVEANLPMVVGKPSYSFDVLDAHGNVWQFVIRSWPNGANPKPVYVLEHISDYVKAYGIGAGDVLGLCLNKDGQLMVEVNSEAVITAAQRTANVKCKPRRTVPAKLEQYVRREAEKLITPELARTTSEQLAVLDAMEVLTSFQAAKKRPLDGFAPVRRMNKVHHSNSQLDVGNGGYKEEPEEEQQHSDGPEGHYHPDENESDRVLAGDQVEHLVDDEQPQEPHRH